MSLLVTIRGTGHPVSEPNQRVLMPVDAVVIGRLDPLHDPHSADDEVHDYEITSLSDQRVAHFTHRYGDGALRCLELGLAALREAN